MFLAIAYAALLFAYLRAWRAIPETHLPEGFEPKTQITVLIPARNEEANLEACLRSVLQCNYPRNLLQVIVIDDFSEDGTAEIVRQLSESLSPKKSGLGSSLTCIRLADHLPEKARFTANKKKAIELGVTHANGEIIVTTDADCVVPRDWLMLIGAAFDASLPSGEGSGAGLVCAPVAFHKEKSLLQKFQSLDFLGMMGITGAGAQLGWHYMANGANLAYRKQVFDELGGYAGNQHRASGDDMFLAQKVAARWPGSVVFLKSLEATVLTEAAPDLKSFWQQRLRWGTKNAGLPDWPLRLSLLTVFVFCWSIWVNLGLAFAYALVGTPANNLEVFLLQMVVKATFDYFFLSEMCGFSKREDLLRWFWPSFFLHTAYIPILGTASIFLKKFKWKGRKTS